MKNRLSLAILGLLILPQGALGEDKVCQTSPNLVAPCFTLRGVLFAANGNPTFRIARTGTKRILGVRDSENPDMPAALHDTMLANGDAFSVRISAEYLVCPLTRDRAGTMQFVCIEKASHERVEPVGNR